MEHINNLKLFMILITGLLVVSLGIAQQRDPNKLEIT